MIFLGDRYDELLEFEKEREAVRIEEGPPVGDLTLPFKSHMTFSS